jgi:hypothetical protein
MDTTTLTDAEFRDRLHRRRPVFPEASVENPASIQEVDTEFRNTRQKRSDIGVANHVLNLLLEPSNPFEPGRTRKPKMEAVVFGTLLALVAIAVLAFNCAAPRP